MPEPGAEDWIARVSEINYLSEIKRLLFFLIMAHICNYLMYFLPKLCLGGPTLQGTEINVLTLRTKLCSSKLHFTIIAGHSDFSLFLRTCPEKCIYCSFFLLINEFSFCQKMLCGCIKQK